MPTRPDPAGSRVLHVEDSEVDARLTAISIERTDPDSARVIERVATLAQALDSIRAHEPDAILLDLELPDSHGLSTLDRVAHAAPRVPIIVFTGTHGPHIQADVLRGGARACLDKDEAQGAAISRALRDAMAQRPARRR